MLAADNEVLLILDNAVVNIRWIEAALVAVEDVDVSAVISSTSVDIFSVMALVLLVLDNVVVNSR